MTTYITKGLCTILLLIAVLPACKDGFEETNTDPNTTPTALPQQLLAPALVNTVATNMLRSRTLNNELMQVTVDASDSEGKIFRYDIKRTQADYTWNNWYSQLTNFKDLYNIASQPLTLNKGYMGISLICQSWIFSMLTDTYGDVPYSESNQSKDGILEPAFDKQKDIYTDIFKKLEEANTLLTGAANVVGSSDPVYNGNVANWRKFGNSLYLRLLLRVSGKSDISATAIAKIKDIVVTNPATYPVMTSNAESAVLRWTGVAYLVSPFVGGVREQDWRAPDIASFFIDNLTKWADPRLFQGSWSIATYNGGYAGIASGYAPGTGVIRKSYFLSNVQGSSTTAKSYITEPLAGNIMNYAELQFTLAEAAAKGWITGTTAQAYYENGALNAITFWLPTYATPIQTYLAAADISWNNNASLDAKMELIHLQKYYAMFWTDFEQWFEYRRTGHPVLPKGTGLVNGGVMPARLTYPVYVQSANPTNYKAAIASQGPDEINTQVWWQKP